nr:MAG TPA: hypothetical protein [Caudoviricetes sp.]DAY27986.1 MAG TPA: hypothetical protein [Caudoviricetes sp.]
MVTGLRSSVTYYPGKLVRTLLTSFLISHSCFIAFVHGFDSRPGF